MKPFIKLTTTELKLYFREPVGLFFTLAFPLILLLIFGSAFGNDPTPMFGGFGSVDVSVPGYIGLMIGTAGLIGLPIGLATYRDQGILRRFRAAPVHPLLILGAQIVVHLMLVLVGVAMLMIVGKLLFDLQLPANLVAVIAATLFAGVAFSAVSFVIAGLVSSARVAQAVGMALLLPMLFLAGSAMPRETLPEGMQRIGDFLPLTYVVELIKDLWQGNGWNVTALIVLTAILGIGLLLSTRTFRWE
ncbi:MAG: ABC transporter permease [Caldilineales bacterium]